VDSASVATALAKYDFPVPGGPYNKKALQGRLFPVNKIRRKQTFNQISQKKISYTLVKHKNKMETHSPVKN